MKTVNFKFDIDQKVRVGKLGFIGIVAACAINRVGNDYYIKTEKGGDWFNETLLSAVEDEND
ncbi:MAG: hypothetical protein LBP37_04200 [Spirochaetaceae bacterium]|jgi:hypothetical protein|nr:hypothetical protein [Spirochaetaceae bacterium]